MTARLHNKPAHMSFVPAAPQYLVRASYLELYNEALHDLLGGKGGRGGGGGGKSSAAAAKRRWQPLELRESPDSGVFVKDLTSTVVQNAKELRVRRRVTERAHTHTLRYTHAIPARLCLLHVAGAEALRRTATHDWSHRHEHALVAISRCLYGHRGDRDGGAWRRQAPHSRGNAQHGRSCRQ